MKNTKFDRLLIGMCFIAGLLSCQHPLGETSIQTSLPVPDGQSRAVFELPPTVSPRTAIPEPITIKNYLLILTAPADTVWKPVNRLYDAGETVSEVIGPGKWDGYLYAYTADTEHPLAQAQFSFEINAGETKKVPVNLVINSLQTLTGNGTLYVKMQFPGELKFTDITEATLTITRLDGSPVLNGFSLREGENSLVLSSGVFISKVKITDRWDRISYFTEAIWILPGEITTYVVNSTNSEVEGEYGQPIMIVTIDPLQSPTLLAPVFEVERGIPVIYSLGSVEQFKIICWYVDGEIFTTYNNSMTFILQTHGRATGMNEILVVVTDKNDLVTSSSTRLNILPEQKPAGYVVYDEPTLRAALDSISASSESDAVINITADFETNPVSLGPAFNGKKIQFSAMGGSKTICLKSKGILFEISGKIDFQVNEGVILCGLEENIGPLINVINNSSFTLKGKIANNNARILKNATNTLITGGISCEDAQVVINGATLENLRSDYYYDYEYYFGNGKIAVGAISGKNSRIELTNTTITGCRSEVCDDPSISVSVLYLRSSTAVINDSKIMNNRSVSLNFQSDSSCLYVSKDSYITLERTKIANNEVYVHDMYNRAGTILLLGTLDMKDGTIIQNNTLQYSNRYAFSETYGASGIFICSQAVLNKSAASIIYGTDNPLLSNKYISADDTPRGTIIIGNTAYFEDGNRVVNNSF